MAVYKTENHRLEQELSEARYVPIVYRPHAIAIGWVLFFAAGFVLGEK